MAHSKNAAVSAEHSVY